MVIAENSLGPVFGAAAEFGSSPQISDDVTISSPTSGFLGGSSRCSARFGGSLTKSAVGFDSFIAPSDTTPEQVSNPTFSGTDTIRVTSEFPYVSNPMEMRTSTKKTPPTIHCSQYNVHNILSNMHYTNLKYKFSNNASHPKITAEVKLNGEVYQGKGRTHKDAKHACAEAAVAAIRATSIHNSKDEKLPDQNTEHHKPQTGHVFTKESQFPVPVQKLFHYTVLVNNMMHV